MLKVYVGKTGPQPGRRVGQPWVGIRLSDPSAAPPGRPQPVMPRAPCPVLRATGELHHVGSTKSHWLPLDTLGTMVPTKAAAPRADAHPRVP